MSDEYTFEITLVSIDGVGKQTVYRILRQFASKLSKTDRFIDVTISRSAETGLTETEVENLESMLSSVDSADIEAAGALKDTILDD